MPQLVLLALLIFAVLVFSRRIRRIIFHVHVRNFFVILTFVTIIALCATVGYMLWKYWWPIYMAKPTVLYEDATLEQDMNPVTPGTGGPYKPAIIQTR